MPTDPDPHLDQLTAPDPHLHIAVSQLPIGFIARFIKANEKDHDLNNQRVINSAAKNSEHNVLGFLFSLWGPEKITINEHTMLAIASNTSWGHDHLERIFLAGHDVYLSEMFLHMAATNHGCGYGIFKLVFEHRPGLTLPVVILPFALSNPDTRLIWLLLEKIPGKITLVESSLLAVLDRQDPTWSLLTELMARSRMPLSLSQEVISKALRGLPSPLPKLSSQRRELWRYIFRERPVNIDIDKEMLHSMAFQQTDGGEMLIDEVINHIDKWKGHVDMTALYVHVARMCSVQFMLFMTAHLGPRPEITGKLLRVVSRRIRNNTKLDEMMWKKGSREDLTPKLKNILSHAPGDFKIPEDVVYDVLGKDDSSPLEALLNHQTVLDGETQSFVITQDIFEAACASGSGEVVQLLLSKKPQSFTVTVRSVKLMLNNLIHGSAMVDYLVKNNGIDFSDSLLKAAAMAGHKSLLLALRSKPEFVDSPATRQLVLKAAVRNPRNGLLPALYDLWGGEVVITEDIMKEAARFSHDWAQYLRYDRNQIVEDEDDCDDDDDLDDDDLDDDEMDDGFFDEEMVIDDDEDDYAYFANDDGNNDGNEDDWEDDVGGEPSFEDFLRQQLAERAISGPRRMDPEDPGTSRSTLLSDASRLGTQGSVLQYLLRTEGARLPMSQKLFDYLVGVADSDTLRTYVDWYIQPRKRIKVTEATVARAARNSLNKPGTMDHLFSKDEMRGGKPKVSAQALVAAAELGCERLFETILMDPRCAITQDTFERAILFQEFNEPGMIELLECPPGRGLKVTEWIVVYSMQRGCTADQMGNMLSRWIEDGNDIDQKIVHQIYKNYHQDQIDEIYSHLADEPEFDLNEDLLKAIVVNEDEPETFFDMYLDDEELTADLRKCITEEIYELAAANRYADLLDIFSKEIDTIEVKQEWRDIASLFKAASSDDIERMEELLEKGVPLEIKDSCGKTPFLVAVSSDSPHTARLLVEKGGADAAAVDYEGRTALFEAAEDSKYDLVNALLKWGCPPGQVDYQGHTAYTYALDKFRRRALLLPKEMRVEPTEEERNAAIKRSIGKIYTRM